MVSTFDFGLCCSGFESGWRQNSAYDFTVLYRTQPFIITFPLPLNNLNRGIARNFMKMKPANRISEISAGAQHFLQDCMCAQPRLGSAWTYTHSKMRLLFFQRKQADLSHCLADMWSYRKCRGSAHLMSSEQVLGENKVKLPNLC